MAPPENLLARARGEYREMPGLRLTVPQACRLWQLDAVACEVLLQALVTEGLLERMQDGAFIMRPTTPKAVKVGLPSVRFRRSA